MVGPGKSLTVSYGTFSCTLEGFDDPLAAMKAIAEHFRDLSAADRHFGAEPVAPDAAMLRRMAEREIGRPLAARLRSGDGMVLRQTATPAPAQPAPAQPAPAQPEPAPPAGDAAAVALPAPDAPPHGAAGPAGPDTRRDASESRPPEAEAPDARAAATDERAAPTEAEAEAEAEAEDLGAFEAEAENRAALADPAEDLGAVLQADGAAPGPFERQTERDVAPKDLQMEPDGLARPLAAGAPAHAAQPAPDAPPLARESTPGPEASPAGTDPADIASAATDAAGTDVESARQAKPGGGGRSVLEAAAETDDASVERLLRQADDALAGADTRRRRDTLTHLKAALAATRADASAGTPPPDSRPEVERQFRADLAAAVRPAPGPAPLPRTPDTGGEAQPARPRPAVLRALDCEGPPPADLPGERVPPVSAPPAGDGARPGPLVLASDLRVLAPAPQPAAPEAPPTQPAVRPRRVATDAPTPPGAASGPAAETEAGDFRAFAARLGAVALPEVLEAAATYLARVEGIEAFSRPQLMRRAAELGGGDRTSREAGLRAFGRLLREGRIVKARRGLYALPDTPRFAAGARRAGR